ncbi:collagen alpha-1(I) chain-like [Stegodyphus dumicola]|uniref:collagen alpha-1(I) chain-like n=1 Tax=Stegodyphus dumicola TaxID=202533 RepID=UPI0015ADAD4C|nr:collagen alpha-1(I) chain-like [Stegodyphus dumicola]
MISLRFLLLAGLISMTVSQGGGGPRASGGPGPPPRGGPPPGGPGGPPPGGPGGPPPGGPGGPPPGGPGGPPPAGPDGPCGPGGPGDCFMSPACKNFSRAIQDEMRAMHERGEGGPENCPDENHEACRWNDMMKARCNVKEKVTAECLKEVNMFMNGECPTVAESTTPQSTTSRNP